MTPQQFESHAPIVDEDTFTLITELEVRKAVRLQYFVSLLGIEASAEDEQSEIAPTRARERLAQAIREEIRSCDTIGLIDAEPKLYILLVNANLGNLPLIIERIAQLVNRHRRPTEGLGELSLSMGAACFPSSARDRSDLFAQVGSLITEARHDQAERHRYRLPPTEP
jgi:hypothetical protein